MGRYCINDRSGFTLNDDGSLDIILSATAPEDQSNWLPVSEEDFHLFMRIYLPDNDALENWVAPVITKFLEDNAPHESKSAQSASGNI